MTVCGLQVYVNLASQYVHFNVHLTSTLEGQITPKLYNNIL